MGPWNRHRNPDRDGYPQYLVGLTGCTGVSDDTGSSTNRPSDRPGTTPEPVADL
jgi:hypothetical protein